MNTFGQTKKRLLLALCAAMALCFALALLCMNVFAAGASITVRDGANVTVDIMNDDLLYEGAGSTGNGNRFADNTAFFTYKAQFSTRTDAFAIATVFKSTNGKIQISPDNESWTTVYYSTSSQDASYDAETYTQSVLERSGVSGYFYYDTDTVEVSGVAVSSDRLQLDIELDGSVAADGGVYIRFSANTNAGNGLDLRGLSLRQGDPTFVAPSGGVTRIDFNSVGSLYEDSGSKIGSMNGTTNRYADNSSYFVYKARFAEKTSSSETLLRLLWRGADRAIYASSSASDYEQLTAVFSLQSGDDYYEIFNLASYVGDSGDVYLKFADADTSNGNGANVYFAELCNNYAPYSSDNGYGQSDAGSKVDMAADTMVQAIDLADAGLYTVQQGTQQTANLGLTVHSGGLALHTQFDSTLTYAVSVPENADPERMYFRAETRDGNYRFSFSTDGTNFTPQNLASVTDGNVRFFSVPVATARAAAESGMLYIRLGCADTASDEQAFLLSLTLFVNRNYTDTLSLPTYYEFRQETIYAGDKEGIDLTDDSGYYQHSLSYRANTNNMDDAGYRYYDENSYGVYKLTFDTKACGLLLVMDIRGGYRISVSDDAQSWTDVLIGEVATVRAQTGDLSRDLKQANLSQLVDMSKGVLYIKVADASTDGGWGGAFTSLALLTVIESETATEAPVLFGEGKLNTAVPVYDPRLLEEDVNTSNAYLGRAIGADGSFTYKFELPSDARSFYIAMKETNIRVDISVNGSSYEELSRSGGNYLNDTNGYGSMETWNLTQYLGQSKTVYLRFSRLSAGTEAVLYTLYAGYNVTENAGTDYENKTYQAFIVGDPSEDKYLDSYDYTQMGTTNKYKEFNRTSYAVYKFAGDASAKTIRLIASVGNSFVLSVSADGVNFRDVVISDQQYYGQNFLSDTTVRDIAIDITALVGGSDTIYVKVADLVDDNDCGAQLRGIGIITMK